MKDQLLRLMEFESMSPAKFADEIGVQRSSISHILNDRNKPSYDFILKILDRFSGLNAEWLITGNGPMMKSSQTLQKVTTQATLFNQKPDQDIEKTENNIGSIKEVENSIPLTKSNNSQLTNNNAEIRTISKEVTNVNNVNYVIIFYNDGTFEKFISK